MATSPQTTRSRRIGGWGFEGVSFPPSPRLLAWLEARIGQPAHPLPAAAPTPPDTPARALPELPIDVSDEPLDRLAHARGQGLADVVRFRANLIPALPDGVCRPAKAEEVELVLRICAAAGVRVIPWGGGTSVTGGVNVLAGDAPVLSLDLERMAGLMAIDEDSGLAAFGPGTAGPAVETALAEHDLTLGHFPQSWELATVGGWAATRSSGQESLGYGRIEDMVAGLEMVAPAGRLEVPALPASAAGPDLRHLAMGSEGRLGVFTRLTLRVRQRPALTLVEAALVPELALGIAAAKDLVRSGVPLTMVRVSDAAETEVAMTVGLGSSSLAPLVRTYLRVRGIGPSGCLLLYGAAGEPGAARDALDSARSLLDRHRAVGLGSRPGRTWQHDRFRHPYLREDLLDLGIATDTLETAVPWSTAASTRQRVAAAIRDAITDSDERVAVLCHVSHPYPDGTSLYFTFFFRCASDPANTVQRWARIKRAATRSLVECGATLSHHHGIGQWHAPWLDAEVGTHGRAILEAAARQMDPDGIINPHVLLDPADRLED